MHSGTLASIDLVTVAGFGAAVAAATVAYGIFAPGSSLFCPVVTRVPDAHAAGRVALTFDDGPLPGVTDRILDQLAAAGARATFFVIGACARDHPDLVRRAHAEGHIIGNHTLAHSYACCLKWRAGWEDEIRRADDLVESIIGRRPCFFRPPMGFKTWHLAGAVRHTGHVVVGWSRRAFDGVPTTTEKIVQRLGPAQGGEILALHDGSSPHVQRRPLATVQAVPRVLDALRARGLRSVTLEELLGSPAYSGESGLVAPPGAVPDAG